MSEQEHTSLSLLARLRDPADSRAWGEFHERYGGLVAHWLRARGVPQHDAEDIGQEVMQIAVVEVPRFEHNGRAGALRRWLREAMSNRLRTLWRRGARQAAAVGGSVHATLAEQLQDPHSALSRAWDEEYRRTTCQHLVETVRGEFQPQTLEAFCLVALGGKSPSEAAQQLGITPNAVRIAQSRVLRRLREIGQEMLDF